MPNKYKKAFIDPASYIKNNKKYSKATILAINRLDPADFSGENAPKAFNLMNSCMHDDRILSSVMERLGFNSCMDQNSKNVAHLAAINDCPLSYWKAIGNKELISPNDCNKLPQDLVIERNSKKIIKHMQKNRDSVPPIWCRETEPQISYGKFMLSCIHEGNKKMFKAGLGMLGKHDDMTIITLLEKAINTKGSYAEQIIKKLDRSRAIYVVKLKVGDTSIYDRAQTFNNTSFVALIDKMEKKSKQ